MHETEEPEFWRAQRKTIPEAAKELEDELFPPAMRGKAEAEAEAAALSDAEAEDINEGRDEDELRRRATENEHERTEKFRDHFERISVTTLYGVAVILGIVILVWFWHVLAPERVGWLSERQYNLVQNFMTGGILVGLVGGHLRKRIG